MTIYGINNCVSVRKAKEFFDKHSITYSFFDISKTPLKEEQIKEFNEFLPYSKLLNSRSKAFRTLKLRDKKISEKEALSAILKDNLVLKRPIIIHGLNGDKKFTIGFNQKEYEDSFL